MNAAPRLIDVKIPARPEGVVLVLHGGGSRGAPLAVSPAQLSVLRMIPVARRVARSSGGRLAVIRLLNSWRGWDTEHTPVADVRWALAQVTERFGADVTVALMGHSLGGRAALLSANQPQVRGVVALAPWVYPDDRVDGVAGTPIVIIHGDADRIASPARAHAVAAELRRQTPVAFVTVHGGKHAMLSHHRSFDGLGAQAAVWTLLGQVNGPVMTRIAAGEQDLTV